jgi:hypothetical protein
MRNATSLLLYFIAVAGASAQDGGRIEIRTGAPTLGFGFDGSVSAIRRIRGIPGAGLIDDLVPLDMRLSRAFVSPSPTFALGIDADGGPLQLVSLSGGAPTPLADALAAPDRVVFSAAGSAALLFERANGRLQAISGLPGNPRVRNIDFPEEPLAMAIDDRSEEILLSAGDDQSLWELDNAAPARRLPVSAAAVAFRSHARDAVAVSRAGGIFLAGDGQDWHLVADPDSRSEDPAGIQMSPDGGYALVAARSGSLSTIELATGARTVIDCGCAPSSLDVFQIGKLYRLTEVSTPPFWLLDASRPSSPAVWFVPPRRIQ